MACWRKAILFGDSLTQYSFQPSGWGAAVADVLQRKADVLNRGFSGYTTDNAVDMLSRVFPTGSLTSGDVVTIFFGANDAVLPGNRQHVPLDRYESNLRKIISHIHHFGIPKTQIVLISPPAIDSKAWLQHKIAEKFGDEIDRRNEITKEYAETCKKVATENNCPFVHLWNAFMAEESFEKLLCDGLHFSESGNTFAAKLVLKELENITKDWEMNYPDWEAFYEAT